MLRGLAASAENEKRTLYPEIKPYQEHMIKVGAIHTLYLAEYGNPNGKPILLCHGGPGAGSQPYHAQYFNPKRYRIILFDQRGAGKSTPLGCMQDNTTQDLINDMEVIRIKLKIEKWALFGGSWGSTLALLYAEQFPHRVTELVLRGIFLARQKDIDAFLTKEGVAAQLNPEKWEEFVKETGQLLVRANIQTVADHILHDHVTLLKQQDETIKQEAAAALARWEKLNSTLIPPEEKTLAASVSQTGVVMGTTEITYMANKFFLSDNQILENANKIEHIPVYIIQGRYDLVCPRSQALELKKVLKKVKYFEAIAGHSVKEPDIVHYLLTATDEIGSNWQLNKLSPVTRAFLDSLSQQAAPQQNAALPPTDEADRAPSPSF